MAGQFAGKVALVTGAGSGIGRASALAFAQADASVVVADIDEEGGTQTVDRIREFGGQATFVRADVSLPNDVAALVSTTISTYGRLDCAHNNAGIEGAVTDLLDYPDEMFDRVIAVNLKSIWLCMKQEVPHMLAQGSGAIVNTSSVAGLHGNGGIPAYSVSKHGVVGLTKSIAMSYATRGIRVNAVCPGIIMTPMLERGFHVSDPEMATRMASLNPMKRMGEPKEIAAAVIWLCSDAASFVTGVAFPVDGGSIA